MKFWMGVALAGAGGAALALWREHYDAAFVIGCIGALAWFLNFRVRLKKTIREADKLSGDSSED